MKGGMVEIQSVILPVIETAGMALALGMAFSPAIAREIGVRDKWHCQSEGCEHRFQDGYLIDAAHDPDKHNKRMPWYNLPTSGKILCLEHHMVSHIGMLQQDPCHNNLSSVRLISQRIFDNGFHTRQYYYRHPEQLDLDRVHLFEVLANYELDPRDIILNWEPATV